MLTFYSTAPGNLLLCGEYSILEEGGLGIACATAPRGRARARLSDKNITRIKAISGKEDRIFECTADATSQGHFICTVYECIVDVLRRKGFEVPVLDIEIDTRSMYAEERKLGFGSSACASVMLCAVLCKASYYTRVLSVPHGTLSQFSRLDVAQIAHLAHYAAQGNRGSGYDIYTSCLGGTIVFAGGSPHSVFEDSHNDSQAVKVRKLADNHPLRRLKIFTYSGRAENDSKQAIENYVTWKRNNEQEAADFFQESQRVIRALIDSQTQHETLEQLSVISELYRRLGDEIAVDSRIHKAQRCIDGDVYKSSGAGKERGIVFRSSEPAV